jgi:hypothetical protein
MMFELPEVERRVAEIHSLIERQRQLIEDLERGGGDITSAQIVFDSLGISLYLHLQDRFRLLAMLNVKAAWSKHLIGFRKDRREAVFLCVPSMIDSLEVEVLYPAWWWWRISEAQGRRHETGSERSVEQSRGLMDKNRITRPTRPDERAKDREVHGHQGPGW